MMSCEKGKVFKRENEGVETMEVMLKRHFSWCDVICIKKVLTVWRVQDGLFRDGCVSGKKTDLKIGKYATGIGNWCVK